MRNALLSGRLAVAIVRNMRSLRLPPSPARTCFACGSNGFTRGNDLLIFHPFPLYKLVAPSCAVHPVALIHKEWKEASGNAFPGVRTCLVAFDLMKNTYFKFANFSLVRTYRDFITKKTRIFR